MLTGTVGWPLLIRLRWRLHVHCSPGGKAAAAREPHPTATHCLTGTPSLKLCMSGVHRSHGQLEEMKRAMYLDVQAHGALQTVMSDKQRLGKLEASRCALLLCDVQVDTLRSGRCLHSYCSGDAAASHMQMQREQSASLITCARASNIHVIGRTGALQGEHTGHAGPH